MIDLHFHLLPGIDDGPTSEAESLDLARAAVAAGTTTVVATPHVSWRYPDNTAASIRRAVDAMTDALAREQIPLRILPGAEIAATHAADLSDEELAALRLGGAAGTHLLVECPMSPSLSGFSEVVAHLRARGHRIVLAHPERCPAFQHDPSAYAALVADGLLGQVTAGALVGRFGRIPQELGIRMVRDGLVAAVASDAHGLAPRGPSIRPELDRAGLGGWAPQLTHDAPLALVSGAPLPPPPERGAPDDGLLRRLFPRG